MILPHSLHSFAMTRVWYVIARSPPYFLTDDEAISLLVKVLTDIRRV
ncbi:hypothetical protein KAX35_01295 [candidate division WOR-3 bacterium]|nr:hypothetical protein [candidate division WOR-3 bacterium]